MRHSNRPHHGDMPMQGSAEYEAVGYPAIPRAPRSPQFQSQPQYMPQMVATNRGYNQTGPFPAQHGPASSRIPAPAHSLSPVAMASARGAAATGGYAAQDTQEVKARPSAKAGFSILFAGAIIGGLIGAVMHARESAADAYLAAAKVEQVQSAKTSANANAADDTALGNIMVPSLPGANNGALPSLIPGAAPPGAIPGLLPEKLDESTTKTKGAKTKGAAAARTKVVNTGAVDKGAERAIAGLDDKDDKPAKAEKPAKAKKGSKDDDDGYTVASSGDKAEKAAAAQPEKPSKKADKAEKTADKGEKSADSDTAPTKKSSKKGDAEAVLRAASGALENSL